MTPRNATSLAGIVVLLGVALAMYPMGVSSPASAASPAAKTTASNGQRRVLYYKAPMGPETSPVPMKDSMGMDYLPVYEAPGEAPRVIAPAPSPEQPPAKPDAQSHAPATHSASRPVVVNPLRNHRRRPPLRQPTASNGESSSIVHR
jgi:hypothetical protein